MYICIIINTNKNIFHNAWKAWKKENNNNNLIDICGNCQFTRHFLYTLSILIIVSSLWNGFYWSYFKIWGNWAPRGQMTCLRSYNWSLSRLWGRADTKISILHMRKSAPEIRSWGHGGCEGWRQTRKWLSLQPPFPVWVSAMPERKAYHIWVWQALWRQIRDEHCLFPSESLSIARSPGALLSLYAFSQGSPSTTASAARDWWGVVESSLGNVLLVWLRWSPHLSHGPHRLWLMTSFSWHSTLWPLSNSSSWRMAHSICIS